MQKPTLMKIKSNKCYELVDEFHSIKSKKKKNIRDPNNQPQRGGESLTIGFWWPTETNGSGGSEH